MWPMLAGIGPLLGDEELGAFERPDGTRSTWFYKDGKVSGRYKGMESVQWQIPSPAAATLPELPWVAVLMDRGTASSGEAVAISFAGRPRARSFGERTAGFSTANQNVPLRDGRCSCYARRWRLIARDIVMKMAWIPM